MAASKDISERFDSTGAFRGAIDSSWVTDDELYFGAPEKGRSANRCTVMAVIPEWAVTD